MINRDMLPGNDCFGCGHHNPKGLKIEISRDPDNGNRLVGIFHPSGDTIGFPGIIHGGAIYTAMDCLAAWIPTILLSKVKTAWILRSASIRYLRPALEKRTVLLSGYIAQEGKKGAPVAVNTEARDTEGGLLAEGRFKVVPLPLERFKEVAGIEQLPENWKYLLGENDA